LGNFQNRNLGPYAWDQINTIYFVPESEICDPSFYHIPEDTEASISCPRHTLSDYEDYHLQPPENPVLGDFM